MIFCRFLEDMPAAEQQVERRSAITGHLNAQNSENEVFFCVFGLGGRI